MDYPELNEAGKKAAQDLIESFKKNLIKEAEDTIGKLYIDIMPWIDHDSWMNFRNEVISGLKGYRAADLSQYDWAAIRSQIFKEHRDQIIKDLDQDNLERIKKLEADIKYLHELKRY